MLNFPITSDVMSNLVKLLEAPDLIVTVALGDYKFVKSVVYMEDCK